jgi:hypothetical protein
MRLRVGLLIGLVSVVIYGTPVSSARTNGQAAGDTVTASANDERSVYTIGAGGPVCKWELDTRGDSGEVEGGRPNPPGACRP